MKRRRVYPGRVYVYRPVLFDLLHPPQKVAEGDRVRVIELPSAPKAGACGQCHIETLSGEFAGMVMTSSLISETDRRSKP